MANTTTTILSVRDQNPPDIDEVDFGMPSKWEKIKKAIAIMEDINMALAVLLGVISILLFLTILNPKLRAHSPMWYYYHLNAVSVVTALLLHTMVNSGIVMEKKGVCYFVMYTIEYICFLLGINIFFLNAEIYFTKILPLQKWQWSPFIRFIISMLASWNFVSVLIIYVVVNNNQAAKLGFHCFYIIDEDLQRLRLILRTVVPGAILLICTIIMIGTCCLKRSRIRITSASGGLREIQTVTQDGETQWICLAVFTNVVFIIRTVALLIVMYGNLLSDSRHFITNMTLFMVHSQSVYLLPLGLFFVADGRAVVKALVCKGIGFISCGKVRFGEDLEQLAVSFGQESGTCVH